MTTKKLTIEPLQAPTTTGEPLPSTRGKKQPVAPSRRARLPSGISYHPTPMGLKYRIRIRSKKKLENLGADKPIDEIFDNLKQAEQRLLNLKYKKEDVKQEFYEKGLAQLNTIKLEQLFEVHFDRYYSKLKSAKEHKSRMNVISKTIIPHEDPKLMLFISTMFSMKDFNKNEIPFGLIPVVEYKTYLQSFIEKRREKVKNQTIVNDLMFIHTALKNANVYFKNIPKIHHPLEDVDFKTLKDQKTYIDKRVKPETRIAIETILIQKSRVEHYREMFVFLSETGVRISEALSILKKDCDLEKGVIFLVSKKNDKPRYLGITRRLREVIEKRTKNIKETDRLFNYSKGTYQTKLRIIRPDLEELGIKFSWHMLRHTFISNGFQNKSVSTLMSETDINNFQHFKENYLNPLEAEKVAIKISKAQQLTVQEMQTSVGHNDPQVTIGTYTHQSEPNQIEILKRDNEELKLMLLEMTKKLNEKR